MKIHLLRRLTAWRAVRVGLYLAGLVLAVLVTIVVGFAVQARMRLADLEPWHRVVLAEKAWTRRVVAGAQARAEGSDRCGRRRCHRAERPPPRSPHMRPCTSAQRAAGRSPTAVVDGGRW
jgi:hypothetical protein